MNIWKLSIANPDSPNWEASTYKGEVIVRAEDERQARMVTAQAFSIATERIPGESTKYPPWNSSEDTICEIMENSEYTPEGEACVLEPQQLM